MRLRIYIAFSLYILLFIFTIKYMHGKEKAGELTGFGKKEETIFTLKGNIYAISQGTFSIPYLSILKPEGVIYTDSLNVPNQSFKKGFPGVTNRIEWFAIEYTGYFYIGKEGRYCFRLTSDDGSKLYIDKKMVINNDGGHPAQMMQGAIKLSPGIHEMRVQYYQGPRYDIALVLEISENGKDYKIFKISDYMPAKIINHGTKMEIILNNDILFDFNSCDLKDESKKVLNDIMHYYLRTTKYRILMIEGHSDDIGTEAQNLSISRKRAESVKTYLASQGLQIGEIYTKGLGKTKPRYLNNSEKNRAGNRRIEMILIK